MIRGSAAGRRRPTRTLHDHRRRLASVSHAPHQVRHRHPPTSSQRLQRDQLSISHPNSQHVRSVHRESVPTPLAGRHSAECTDRPKNGAATKPGMKQQNARHRSGPPGRARGRRQPSGLRFQGWLVRPPPSHVRPPACCGASSTWSSRASWWLRGGTWSGCAGRSLRSIIAARTSTLTTIGSNRGKVGVWKRSATDVYRPQSRA